MYKVMIVDDESWVVESLKGCIHWEEYGFEVVETAYNGVEGYEKIIKTMPDLVFVDIRMPGMNGLELIKKIKESYSCIQFIVLSGYAEFAYAQKALNYKALGYCLKPFDESEIITLLKEAKKVLVIPEKIELYDLLELLERNDGESIGKVNLVLGRYGIEPGQNIIAIVVIGTRGLDLSEGMVNISFKTGTFKRAYFVHGSILEMKKYLEKQLCEEIKSIGISNPVRNVFDIAKALNEADIAAYQFFVSGQKGVYGLYDKDPSIMNECLKNLNRAVSKKDMVSVDKCFNQMVGILTDGCNMKQVYHVYNVINSFCCGQFLSNLQDSSTCHYEQLIVRFKDVNELMHDLKKIVIKEIGVQPEGVLAKTENKSLKNILVFINENFYKDISVQYLADKYHISPNYISQLFKREMGLNLTGYIMKLRMEYARSLLTRTDLSIQEISEKVGYNDYFYFAKIFKKNTSKTPSRYRIDMKK